MKNFSDKSKRSLRIFGIVAICFCGVLIGLLIAVWMGSETVRPEFALVTDAQVSSPGNGGIEPPKSPENEVGSLLTQLAIVQKDLEAKDAVFSAQKEEIDYLTHISEIMLTVVGLFSIILGAVSWKTFDDQRQSARLAVAEELQRLDDLRNELQLDFPMLGRIQSNFRSILISLRSECSQLAPRDDTFSRLNPGQVQRILFYESAITTALLLNTTGYERELSEIYRLLGIFHGSKFNSTLEDNRFSSAKDRRDYDRAMFYFDRAIDLDSESYLAYFHKGYFTQYYDDQAIAALSRKYFELAAAVGADYQRPYISIAIIELEAFAESVNAIKALEKASSRSEYDEGQKDPRSGYIQYLEACAQCLLAKESSGITQDESLERASALLTACANLKSPRWTELNSTFEDDRSKYFRILEEDPRFSQSASDALTKLSSMVTATNLNVVD
jgi:tetratricopeptide (TPR) repeat protein